MPRTQKKGFIVKTKGSSRKRIGKKEYLKDAHTRDLMRNLNQYFECKFNVARIRVGRRQTIETLINEEALLLAQFLRDERKAWIPGIAVP